MPRPPSLPTPTLSPPPLQSAAAGLHSSTASTRSHHPTSNQTRPRRKQLLATRPVSASPARAGCCWVLPPSCHRRLPASFAEQKKKWAGPTDDPAEPTRGRRCLGCRSRSRSCSGQPRRHRHRHGGADGAELRADGAQGGQLRRGACRHGRHPLRALDAPRLVQGGRRPPPPPTPPGPLVSNRFSLPSLILLLLTSRSRPPFLFPLARARSRSHQGPRFAAVLAHNFAVLDFFSQTVLRFEKCVCFQPEFAANCIYHTVPSDLFSLELDVVPRPIDDAVRKWEITSAGVQHQATQPKALFNSPVAVKGYSFRMGWWARPRVIMPLSRQIWLQLVTHDKEETTALSF